MVDHGIEPRSGKTKDYKIYIYCFSVNHTVLMRKCKDFLSRVVGHLYCLSFDLRHMTTRSFDLRHMTTRFCIFLLWCTSYDYPFLWSTSYDYPFWYLPTYLISFIVITELLEEVHVPSLIKIISPHLGPIFYRLLCSRRVERINFRNLFNRETLLVWINNLKWSMLLRH